MSGKSSAGHTRRNTGIKGFSPHLKAMRKRDAEGVKGVDGCEADGRNVKWRRLSFEEQLAILNQRFPEGAVKQKERIRVRMEAAKTKPLATEPAKKDRIEEDVKKKMSSREKKFDEMKVERDAARFTK